MEATVNFKLYLAKYYPNITSTTYKYRIQLNAIANVNIEPPTVCCYVYWFYETRYVVHELRIVWTPYILHTNIIVSLKI